MFRIKRNRVGCNFRSRSSTTRTARKTRTVVIRARSANSGYTFIDAYLPARERRFQEICRAARDEEGFPRGGIPGPRATTCHSPTRSGVSRSRVRARVAKRDPPRARARARANLPLPPPGRRSFVRYHYARRPYKSRPAYRARGRVPACRRLELTWRSFELTHGTALLPPPRDIPLSLLSFDHMHSPVFSFSRPIVLLEARSSRILRRALLKFFPFVVTFASRKPSIAKRLSLRTVAPTRFVSYVSDFNV